jgi:hypothetical protein
MKHFLYESHMVSTLYIRQSHSDGCKALPFSNLVSGMHTVIETRHDKFVVRHVLKKDKT